MHYKVYFKRYYKMNIRSQIEKSSIVKVGVAAGVET